jgi:hypothetical protein
MPSKITLPPDATSKPCSNCKADKPLDEFFRVSPSVIRCGYSSRCKACHSSKAKRLLPHPCEQCGGPIVARLSTIRFCTKRCSGLARRTPHNLCETCGTPFKGHSVKARFCSRACMYPGAVWKHGESHTVEYRAWQSLKQRCLNPAFVEYSNYGARGIRVCDEWLNAFDAFLAHVGRRPSPKHSLDRIDNEGNYEPGNVRWTTNEVQQRNKRTNRWLTVDGETRCMTDWAAIMGISYITIHYRLKKGWPAELAVKLPLGARVKKHL